MSPIQLAERMKMKIVAKNQNVRLVKCEPIIPSINLYSASTSHSRSQCFRVIPWRTIEWRRRSDFSPLFPAALRAVAPTAAAQAFDSALSWGDAVGRRPAHDSRTSTEGGNVFALDESWVLGSC